MLAGLFGVRGGVLAGIEDIMRHWLSTGTQVSRWTDQYFLRSCIWPLARDASLTHDPIFAYGSLVAPGTRQVPDQYDHVGANHGSTVMEIKLDHPDGCAVHWSLVDAAGKGVSCDYVGALRDRRVAISLPRSHGERIRRGEWKVEWRLTPPESGSWDRSAAPGVA